MRDERTYEGQGRAIVRCKKCKHTGNLTYTTRTVVWAFNGRPASRSSVVVGERVFSLGRGYETKHALADATRNVCPGCGANYSLRINVVKGVVVKSKPCSERCMGATGPACECACGGEMHGAGHGSF